MNKQTHNIVINAEDNSVFMEDGKIMLESKIDQTLCYVPLCPELEREFDISSKFSVTINSEEESGDGNKNEANTGVKFVWNHNSTLLLLDEYQKRLSKFRNPKIKKRTLWEEISKVMQGKGYNVKADLLDRKLRNMKITYREIVDNNNKKKSTGTSRINWEYFDIFQQIFHNDKTVHVAPVMYSPIQSENNNNSNNSTCSASSSACSSNVLINETLPFIPSTSFSNLSPLPSKRRKQVHLDKVRNKLIAIEEQKLIELKKVRECMEENNRMQKEKLAILKDLANK